MLSCPLLKNHLAVSPTGFIQPCCRFKISEHDEEFLNIKDSSLSQGRQSQGFKKSMEVFASGQFPKGCSSCQIEESQGIQSMRQKALANDSASSELRSVEFYLGNACNMKCRSCSPQYSSRWEKEGAALGWTSFEYPKVDVAAMLSTEETQQLQHLKLLGGEPFYIKSFYEIIKNLVDTNSAARMTLEVSSNVSVFPEPSVLEQLRQFKNVQLSLSIDDIGKRAEYLRSGTNWQKVSQNLRRWFEFSQSAKNFETSVHVTVSAYNVLHIDSIILYLYKMGWRDITIMTIKDPTALSPLRIPVAQRELAWERMAPLLTGTISRKLNENIKKILYWPEELDPEDFYVYSQKMDTLRGESLEKYWSNSLENTPLWYDAP